LGKFLKIALIAALLLVLVCGGGVFYLFKSAPPEFEVSRELVINAPSAEVHPHVEDLKAWQVWSYWTPEHDPSLKVSFSGAERGVGALSSWTSAQGPGGMEITASDPTKGMWYDLRFGEAPDEVVSKCAMQYEPAGDGTKVVMSMRGSFPGPMRIMNWAPIADGMLGPQFEFSLEGLKQVSEASE
jgi:hypothetical protein